MSMLTGAAMRIIAGDNFGDEETRDFATEDDPAGGRNVGNQGHTSSSPSGTAK